MSTNYAATFNPDHFNAVYSRELFAKYGLEAKHEAMGGMAQWLRAHAHVIDADLDYLNRRRGVPVIEHLVSDRTSTVAQRTLMYEALSYGDMNGFFSAPNPSLSGILLRELGSPEQKELFFNVVANERCRTFFGITEPDKGSDAANVGTSYVHGRLNGTKWLVGAADTGHIGTVLCRTGDGPMDRCTLLLTPEVLQSPRVHRERLNVSGFSGALLSSIHFDDLEVPQSAILGMHLRPLERGVFAIIKTFHRMRTCVAGMALGQAQAALDYARDLPAEPTFKRELDRLATRIRHARALTLKAAETVDASPLDRKWPATVKAIATETCEEVVLAIVAGLAPGSLLGHPFLLRAYRNTFGFEFMEGVSVVQRNHVFSSAF